MSNLSDYINLEKLNDSLPINYRTYKLLLANGTPSQNANSLREAYNEAKTITPNNQPLSDLNRFTIVIGPGLYDMETSKFVVDTPYIDIISLTGEPDAYVYVNGWNRNTAGGWGTLPGDTFTCVWDSDNDVSSIWVTANNVKITGINSRNCAIKQVGTLPLTTFKNCVGGRYSFISAGYQEEASTYINCIANGWSFGGIGSTASGTYENCKSVKTTSPIDTVYVKTYGMDYCFGKNSSGIFNNCTSGIISFGFGGTISGTLSSCVASGSNSFNNITSGKLYYCRLDDATFPAPTNGGKLIYCINNDIAI